MIPRIDALSPVADLSTELLGIANDLAADLAHLPPLRHHSPRPMKSILSFRAD
jgi:hypothetical protein